MTDDTTAPPPEPPVATGEHAEKMVPYARFAEVVAERNALRGETADLRAQVTDATKTAEAAIAAAKSEAEEARTALEALQADATWKDHAITLAREGIHDDDVSDFIRYQWGKVNKPGEDGATPEFGAWLSEVREAKPHLFPTASGTAKPPPPSTNRGAKPPPATSAYSADQLAKMSQAEYMAHRAEIRKAVGVATADES